MQFGDSTDAVTEGEQELKALVESFDKPTQGI